MAKPCVVQLSQADISRIIEMAWEDRTPFESITTQFFLDEADILKLMRAQLNAKAFKNWRARVSGRKTKHLKRRSFTVSKAYCPTQYKHR